MILKHLKVDDVFHFEDDNAEKELIVYQIIGSIIEFEAIHSTQKFCISKEWDYMGERKVVKLYNKSE